MSELKIGDKLYRYVSAFPPRMLVFEVMGVHEYKTTNQYHLLCLSCNDHTACEILAVKDDYNSYAFVKTLNNNDEDEDQRHWHTHGELLYTIREKALLKRMEKVRADKKTDIEKAEKKLKSHEDELKKIDGFIDEYNTVLNKLEEQQNDR